MLTEILWKDLATCETLNQVSVVIVNRMTLNLTRGCLESLLDNYPTIKVLLIDNNSNDESTLYIEKMSARLPNVNYFINRIPPSHHGRGLFWGAMFCGTPRFITLDSDVIVNRGGWIEKMLERFEKNPKLFAIGNVIHAGKSCVRKGNKRYRYVHPVCAMWSRPKYNKLGRFRVAGQPVCAICHKAVQMGCDLETLEGKGHITHVGGGTRARLNRVRQGVNL